MRTNRSRLEELLQDAEEHRVGWRVLAGRIAAANLLREDAPDPRDAELIAAAKAYRADRLAANWTRLMVAVNAYDPPTPRWAVNRSGRQHYIERTDNAGTVCIARLNGCSDDDAEVCMRALAAARGESVE